MTTEKIESREFDRISPEEQLGEDFEVNRLGALALAEETIIDPEIMESVREQRRERLAMRELSGLEYSNGNGSRNLHRESISEPISKYFSDIGQFRLMTKEEEVVVGDIIQRTTLALESADLEAREREVFVGEREEAIEIMMTRNLRLVVSNAKRFLAQGIEFDDAIQAGSLGLRRAAEKFDPGRGFKFSTYATWWIRQRIQREIKDVRLGTVKKSVADSDLAQSLAAYEQERGADGKPLSTGELAADIGTTEQKIKELQAQNWMTVSLEQPIGNNGDGWALGDIVVDDGEMYVDDEVIREMSAQRLIEDIRITISELAPTLSKNSKRYFEEEALFDMFSRRIGLNGYETHSISSLTRIFNMSGVTVTERLEAILDSLRNKLDEQEYAD